MNQESGALLESKGLRFVEPATQAQRGAVAGLLGTDVCPDREMTAGELQTYVNQAVRGSDQLDQPFLPNWLNGKQIDTVNLGFLLHGVTQKAAAQRLTDQQRAAVVCALSFFAIEQLQHTHNWTEFVQYWDQEYTKALETAELALYGAIPVRAGQFFGSQPGANVGPGAKGLLSMSSCGRVGSAGSGSSAAGTSGIGGSVGLEGSISYSTELQTTAGTPANLTPTQPAVPYPNEDDCEEVPPFSSPLVLPGEGEDLELLSRDQGVLIDLLATGQKVKSGWVWRGALLALDLIGNGRIDDGAELFGEATRMPTGQRAPDGFAALAQYDGLERNANGNGQIDPGDQVFGQLRLWTDRNHDGRTQPGELTSLDQAGIRAIELVPRSAGYPADRAAGNRVLLEGRVRYRNGAVRTFYDVWFAYERPDPELLSAKYP